MLLFRCNLLAKICTSVDTSTALIMGVFAVCYYTNHDKHAHNLHGRRLSQERLLAYFIVHAAFWAASFCTDTLTLDIHLYICLNCSTHCTHAWFGSYMVAARRPETLLFGMYSLFSRVRVCWTTYVSRFTPKGGEREREERTSRVVREREKNAL